MTNLSTFFLSVTQRCNLSCSYCSANAGPDRDIGLPLDTALQRVKEWLTLGRYNSDRLLVFSGGEPSLWGINKLHQVCEYARHLGGPALRFGIQTNGTLVKSDFIDWCKTWDIEPSISMDGPPGLSDDRRGLGRLTERGFKLLKEADISFAVIICLTRVVIDQLDSVLDYFLKRGITKIRMNTIGSPPTGRREEQVRAEELLRAKKKIYHYMQIHQQLDELNTRRQIEWFDASILNHPVIHNYCTQEVCGAGRQIAAVNPDGRIAPCIERSMTGGLPLASSFAEPTDVVDDYWKGYEGWSPCQTCVARPICDHGCPVYHKLDHERFEVECDTNQKFYEFLVDTRAVRVLINSVKKQ